MTPLTNQLDAELSRNGPPATFYLLFYNGVWECYGQTAKRMEDMLRMLDLHMPTNHDCFRIPCERMLAACEYLTGRGNVKLLVHADTVTKPMPRYHTVAVLPHNPDAKQVPAAPLDDLFGGNSLKELF